MKKVKMGMGMRGMRFQEKGREWRLQMTWLCVLRVMVGRFVEVCRRRGLRVFGGKSKVMMLNGEEELECGFCIEGMRLKHVSEFKYSDAFWPNQVQMRQSVV